MRVGGWGQPWRLPPAERVLLVAVYYRTDLTNRFSATAPTSTPG
ncbi:hypothetical protein ACF1GW_22530 [Streptomyces achromogenes]